jgi:hypothetical protein
MASNIHAVPDDGSKPAQRSTTTSFRIPTYWFNKVQDEAKRVDESLSAIYLRALTQYFGTFDSESWSTVDDADFYDRTRFYTHSEDKKGHSFHVRANIPKPLGGELGSLVQSGMVPAYRSVGDIVRDAVYHRVKEVSNMIDAGEVEQAVDMAMLHSEELRMLDEAQQAEQLIEALRTNASAMFSREGDRARLKRYLAQRREIADSIPEPYRADYLAAVDDFDARLAKEEAKAKPKRRRR